MQLRDSRSNSRSVSRCRSSVAVLTERFSSDASVLPYLKYPNHRSTVRLETVPRGKAFKAAYE
jgi:hypothetical protein